MIHTSKWIETFKISWSNRMAYRLNFVLQIVGPAIVFFFVKYSLWSAIFDTAKSSVIQGYDLTTMITYHVWVMIIALLAQSSNSINISEDIRLGRISSYLIYPFDFWKFHTAGFIAHTSLQLIICAVTLGIVFISGITQELHFYAIFSGLLVTIFVAFLWFSVQYTFGLMAFWFEETWVFRVIFLTTSAFLSGAIIPLEIFPKWFADILMWTPFPYMTYIPARIFMGNEYNLIEIIVTLIFWIFVSSLLATLVWKKGLRHYTAAGM